MAAAARAGAGKTGRTSAPTTSWSPLDGSHFRTVLGHFCTGVTVITSMDGEEPVGFTCQSFSSLSLEPPLVVFCPGRSSTSWPRIRRSGRFCANVLASDQEPVCRTFAWIEGAIESETDGGDHLVVVGRVADFAVARDADPLLFYRGRYGHFVPWSDRNGS
jgi:3-hydroxy-9,10-secoandrosta-1,3,5(10)-triene-9,17-dione monooxygenase reductase component